MTDHVFGGMTRPPTVLGVPQGIFAVLLIATIVGVLAPVAFHAPFVVSIGIAAFCVLLFLTARILCERDHNIFRYLQVRLSLWLRAPGRRIGKGITTYSPAPLRKR